MRGHNVVLKNNIANSYDYAVDIDVGLYPVKLSTFSIFHIYFSRDSLRGQGPLLEAWWATFGLRTTGWEPLS